MKDIVEINNPKKIHLRVNTWKGKAKIKRLGFTFQELPILAVLFKFIVEFKNSGSIFNNKKIESLKYGNNKQERTVNLYYIAG